MSNAPPEVQAHQVNGNSGANTLYDTWFATEVRGYGGNDVIVAFGNEAGGTPYQPSDPYWPDFFDGGSGSDTVSYLLSVTGVSASLATGEGHRILANGSLAGRDEYASIENLWGSNHADVLDGDAENNTLLGYGGNDTLGGLGGNDFLSGGSGHDLVYGGSGDDTIQGNSDNDRLYGGTNNDTIDGGSGNDRIYGESGNDVLTGGTGNDRIDGGSGSDRAVFSDVGYRIVNLISDEAWSATEADTLVSIEHVTTGAGADTVVGDSANNSIRTGSGDDHVFAHEGNDTVEGGNGDDELVGNWGNDVLYGGNHDDRLWGMEDVDVLVGEGGNDRLDGGAANDVLNGGSGNDLILGGQGNDWIATGSGADVIRWEDGHFGVDTITDFNVVSDRLSFGEDFLAADVGPGSLDQYVVAATNGANTDLYANLDWGGWQKIAVLQNVSAGAVQSRINDGSILAVSLSGVGGGGPGGLQPPQLDLFL